MVTLTEEVLDYDSGMQNKLHAVFAECSRLPALTFQLNLYTSDDNKDSTRPSDVGVWPQIAT